MHNLKVMNRHTGETLVTCMNVTEFTINQLDSHWILHITYFDEDIEQDIRDSMRLCEAASKKWKDDLTAHWSEEY